MSFLTLQNFCLRQYIIFVSLSHRLSLVFPYCLLDYLFYLGLVFWRFLGQCILDISYERIKYDIHTYDSLTGRWNFSLFWRPFCAFEHLSLRCHFTRLRFVSIVMCPGGHPVSSPKSMSSYKPIQFSTVWVVITLTSQSVSLWNFRFRLKWSSLFSVRG